jgi:hypothetical protein
VHPEHTLCIIHLRIAPDVPAVASIDIIVTDCGCANPVSINVGSDQNICAGDVVNLVANIQNATNLTWSTSGDGAFDNINANPAQYVPGPNDISLGVVKIKATSEDPDGSGPCFAAVDELTIIISKTIISFTQVNPLMYRRRKDYFSCHSFRWCIFRKWRNGQHI